MKPPETERWPALRLLVGELLDLAPERRDERLRAVPPTLAAEARAILAGAEGEDAERFERDVLARAASAMATWSGATTAPAPPPYPSRIGAFEILGVLGEGGMGHVFLAEQSEPLRRKVALKLIHSTLVGPVALARFAAERQAMAQLQHPNVAQIFEAGTTAEGFPYFAMELVEGRPLDQHCDRERLGIEQRLHLFAAVCAGVEHAHQKGILHRDLKPSNVLVSTATGEPVPKIIDFGIARALDDPLAPNLLTRGGVIGTPAYMSPEAFSFGEAGVDLDTRADVYALGVLLYELLTGRRPLELAACSPSQVIAKVTHEEPLAPSARVAAGDAADAELARRRGHEPSALRRRLAGDLDGIVLKAVAKDRHQRYGSAAELAADVERHLRHEPVSARPPSRRYLAAKFVRRHRATVAAAALVLTSLVAGVIGTSLASVRARRAEAEARQEAAVAARVSAFLEELFAVSDPSQARGETVTARELLDRGAERIGKELADEPLVRARLQETMGNVYAKLGLYPQAAPLLEESLAVRTAGLGERHLDVARSLESLGGLYGRQGRYDEAERLFRRALAIRQSLQGAEHFDVAESLVGLALVEWSRGHYEAFEPLARRVLAIRERRLGPDHPDLAPMLNNLATSYTERGRLEEALAMHRRVAAIRVRAFGPDSPELAVTWQNLGNVYRDLWQPEEAERSYRRSLTVKERVLGPDHPSVALTLSNLGVLYFLQGRLDEAAPLLERAAAIRQKKLGPEHRHTASSLVYLGLLAWKQGRLEEAEPPLRRGHELLDRLLPPDHENQAAPLWGLASLYRDQGRYAEAEPLFRRALAIREKTSRPGHPELRFVLLDYAAFLRRTGRLEQAAAMEQRAEAGRSGARRRDRPQ